ncbi:unnamed protein product [Effrenium voratum]|nr:unnamed protein product [Effrenium voratum]
MTGLPGCSRCGLTPVDMVGFWDDGYDRFRWIRTYSSSVLAPFFHEEWCPSSMDWLPAWQHPFPQNGRIYCPSCWRSWAWYVKEGGSAYALPERCEALASAHVEIKSKRGGPFLCVTCNKAFNKKTLESHLLLYHRKDQPNWKALQSSEVETQTTLMWVSDDYHLDLSWEFQAKGSGGYDDWQPFMQGAQEELETHFKLLQQQTGPSEVIVSTNGYSYAVDLNAMTQRNLKTNRTRSIRRQEVKKDSGPKQLEQGSDLADLLAERDQLKKDLNNQRTKVKALTEQVAALQKDLEAVEHCQQMTFQESWRASAQLGLRIFHRLAAKDPVIWKLQEALRAACTDGHYNQCGYMRFVTVVSVEQIHNTQLWNSYEFRKEQIRKEESLPASHVVQANKELSKACSWARLDADINEVLVLHGTLPENVDKIASGGFDERLARQGGLFGQGSYFTDESCKSFQYSGAYDRHAAGPSGCEGCIIISRVVLGYPYFATGQMKHLKTEPFRDDSDPSKGHCHCVVASSGISNGQGATQVHREFVVFNRYQAYPELLVRFRVP